jgi:ElaB/YqjD/DUF883 family membrane-anchored ribosome-binding protein
MNTASQVEQSIIDNVITSFRTDVMARVDEAKKQGFMTIVKTKTFVEKNPFQSIALAFGAGYLFKLVRPGIMTTLAVVGGAAFLGQKLGLK